MRYAEAAWRENPTPDNELNLAIARLGLPDASPDNIRAAGAILRTRGAEGDPFALFKLIETRCGVPKMRGAPDRRGAFELFREIMKRACEGNASTDEEHHHKLCARFSAHELLKAFGPDSVSDADMLILAGLPRTFAEAAAF